MIDDGDSNTYEEQKERHPKAQYKLKSMTIPLPKTCPKKKNMMTTITSP